MPKTYYFCSHCGSQKPRVRIAQSGDAFRDWMKIKNFSIYADVVLPDFDSEIRMHWTGDGWDANVENSKSYTYFEDVKADAKRIKREFKNVKFNVLLVKIINEHEIINI